MDGQENKRGCRKQGWLLAGVSSKYPGRGIYLMDSLKSINNARQGKDSLVLCMGEKHQL